MTHLAVDSALAGVPERWRRSRLKAETKRLENRRGTRDLDLLSLASAGYLSPRDQGQNRQRPAEESIPRYLAVEAGDLVVNPMWLTGGSVAVSSLSGAVSPDYRVFRPGAAVVPRFLHHVLRSQPYMDQYRLYTRADTTFDRRVQQSDLDNLPLALPNVDEQRRIADFLDDQVSRIDQAVSRRRWQVSLLALRDESAVVSALRGESDAESPKDSGLDWLGATCRSWPVLSVTSQFAVVLGKMLNEERTVGGRLRTYLRNTNVQWDRIETHDLKQMDFPLSERRRYEVLNGDLLICEGGQPGRAAIWSGDSEIYYQKALHRARSRGRSLPRWLFYCLRAAVARDAFGAAEQTTIAHLTSEQLRATKFPFPEPSIQERLVRLLDENLDASRNLAEALDRSVRLLSERKRALITAAVTGEFDVTTASGRGVA